MKYLVDAGAIVRVNDISARSAANVVAIDLGDRASYPITVHETATGKQTMFLHHAEEKKPVARVSQAKFRKRA